MPTIARMNQSLSALDASFLEPEHVDAGALVSLCGTIVFDRAARRSPEPGGSASCSVRAYRRASSIRAAAVLAAGRPLLLAALGARSASRDRPPHSARSSARSGRRAAAVRVDGEVLLRPARSDAAAVGARPAGGARAWPLGTGPEGARLLGGRRRIGRRGRFATRRSPERRRRPGTAPGSRPLHQAWAGWPRTAGVSCARGGRRAECPARARPPLRGRPRAARRAEGDRRRARRAPSAT